MFTRTSSSRLGVGFLTPQKLRVKALRNSRPNQCRQKSLGPILSNFCRDALIRHNPLTGSINNERPNSLDIQSYAVDRFGRIDKGVRKSVTF